MNQDKLQHTPPTIHITNEEKHLFQIIVNAANWKNLQDTSIRVAGGWVRDKLLESCENSPNKKSFVDIDIALGGMNGVEFATIVKDYLEWLAQNDVKNKLEKMPKVGVISANPDQSKHLETATMNLFDMDIDFVNLRAEELYTENSRIPTSTNPFGTPLQDAMRRDFTINALFYNLRTNQVEDYTQMGLHHLLHQRMIQTPIDPHITFLDDPLRVLRAIRFAIRFEIPLSPEVQTAALSDSIQIALCQKVSRERIGKELEGMLTGKRARPNAALGLISELHLSDSVFSFPNMEKFSLNVNIPESQGIQEVIQGKWKDSEEYLKILPGVLSKFEQVLTSIKSNECSKSININYRMLHLSTFLLPFFSMIITDKKGKELSLPQWMLKEGIKFKNTDINAIGNHVRNLLNMKELLQKQMDFNASSELITAETETTTTTTTTSTTGIISRLEAGLLLRNLKEEWLTNLILATVATTTHSFTKDPNSKTSILQASIHVFQQIQNFELHECWKLKPILDGKKVIQRLSLPKGPIVGVYLEEQMKFMLMNPNSTQEECEQYLMHTRRKRQLDGLDDITINKNKK